MTLRSEIIEREQTPISYNDMAKIWRGRIKPNFVELDKLPDDPTVRDFFGGEDTCAVLCNLHNPSKLQFRRGRNAGAFLGVLFKSCHTTSII